MINVTLFSRQNCHLCDEAEKDLAELQEKFPHKLFVIDIESDPDLLRTYAFEIPVIKVGPYTLKAPFDVKKLEVTLGAASDRHQQLEEVEDQAYRKRLERAQVI